MTQNRSFKILTSWLVTPALLTSILAGSVQPAFALGKSPQKDLEDLDYPAAVGITQDHLSRLRDRFKDEKLSTPLFNNPYIMMSSLLMTFERELKLCAELEDSVKTNCMADNLEDFAERASEDHFIEKTVAHHFNRFAEILIYKEGKPSFDAKIAEEIAEDYAYLPDLAQFLRSRNTLKKARDEVYQTGKYDSRVFSLAAEIFERELSEIGDVSLQEYVLATYDSVKIQVMGNLLFETIQYIAAQDSFVVISQHDTETHERFQKAKIAEIDSLIAQMAALQTSPKVSSSLESEEDTPSQAQLVDRLIQVRKEMDEENRVYTSGEKRISLAHSDLYRFTQNYLNLRLKEETQNAKGKLTNVKPPRRADLLMAAYLSGKIDPEVFTAVLEFPEVREKYEHFWDKVLNYTLTITRTVGPIIPTVGTYIPLAFIIYDAYEKRGDHEKQVSQEAQLIR